MSEPMDLFRSMLRVRRFEERCVELYSETKIRGFLHLYIGEEAVATGVMAGLRADDAVVATYREHGHALLRGMSAREVMAEMYGKVTGCSRGRGGSMHLFDKDHPVLRRQRDRRWRVAAQQWVWPWPTTCRSASGDACASSAKGRWPRGSSTSR